MTNETIVNTITDILNHTLAGTIERIFDILGGVLMYIVSYFASLIDSVVCIPTQFLHIIFLSLVWFYIPDEVQLSIRARVIRFIGFLTILLYKIMSKPINKAKAQLKDLFGDKVIVVIDTFLKIYGGYRSFEEMIHHRVYKYTYLNRNIKTLGRYTLVEINGKYVYIPKFAKEKNPFADQIIVYVKNGREYDITPYNDIPSDLPNGHYELRKKVGSEWVCQGEYSNPNNIILKPTRKF